MFNAIQSWHRTKFSIFPENIFNMTLKKMSVAVEVLFLNISQDETIRFVGLNPGNVEL